MIQHWHVNPLPPPDESSGRADGFVGVALWALIVIGPLVYFGQELGVAESWLSVAYKSVESLAGSRGSS